MMAAGSAGVPPPQPPASLGARASRPHDEGFLGARASRPHQAWHSLAHLPHLDQPGTAPWLSFGLADAVLAHRVAACSIALKLSGRPKGQDAGGTPALPGDAGPGGAVGSDRRVTSQKADLHPLRNSRLPESRAPAPGPGGSLQSETTDYCGLSRARTLSGEAGWRQNILSILSIHVNQGSTPAQRRDQTPGASFRDLGVTSWSFVPLRGYLFVLRATTWIESDVSYYWSAMRASPRSLRSFPGCT